MSARDTEETNRVSSPIELLFDLTFVVAIAQIATQLALSIEHGKGASAIIPFLMVFFAIWWAWINFTWFASSYDTDDVPYRVLTLVQMAGVLVLAAGVPVAFASQNFVGITLGYFIMRVGLVAQWTRAAVEDPNGRRTAARYAIGIVIVQLGWIGRVFLPVTPANELYTVYLAFVVLALLDVSVPYWAERTGSTNWHPHHIAERYGLFTIILLGESVAALTGGIQLIIREGAPSGSLVTVGICSLVLVFALWWLYFMQPAGDGLAVYRARSFIWGYGHYAVFGALAALGGGLEVVVASVGGEAHIAPVVAAYSVAVPVGVYLLALWAVHAPIVPRSVVPASYALPAAVVVLLLPVAADSLGVPVAFALIVLVVVALVAAVVVRKDRAMRAATKPVIG